MRGCVNSKNIVGFGIHLLDNDYIAHTITAVVGKRGGEVGKSGEVHVLCT